MLREKKYRCTVRQYPQTLHSAFYNLWRDDCGAFHLAQLESFRVNKHNLFLVSLISIVLSFSLTSTINVFISRPPLVLQRHSPGTQLSHQLSKSICTLLLPSASFLTPLLLQLPWGDNSVLSPCSHTGNVKMGHILCFSGLEFVSVSAGVLSSPPGCLLSDPGAHCKHLSMSELSFQPWYLAIQRHTALQSKALWDMTNAFSKRCLIYSAFWNVSKTCSNVSWACPQLVSTWLAGWYLQPCFIYRWSIFFPLRLFVVSLWIAPVSLSKEHTWGSQEVHSCSQRKGGAELREGKQNSCHLVRAAHHYH